MKHIKLFESLDNNSIEDLLIEIEDDGHKILITDGYIGSNNTFQEEMNYTTRKTHDDIYHCKEVRINLNIDKEGEYFDNKSFTRYSDMINKVKSALSRYRCLYVPSAFSLRIIVFGDIVSQEEINTKVNLRKYFSMLYKELDARIGDGMTEVNLHIDGNKSCIVIKSYEEDEEVVDSLYNALRNGGSVISDEINNLIVKIDELGYEMRFTKGEYSIKITLHEYE